MCARKLSFMARASGGRLVRNHGCCCRVEEGRKNRRASDEHLIKRVRRGPRHCSDQSDANAQESGCQHEQTSCLTSDTRTPKQRARTQRLGCRQHQTFAPIPRVPPHLDLRHGQAVPRVAHQQLAQQVPALGAHLHPGGSSTPARTSRYPVSHAPATSLGNTPHDAACPVLTPRQLPARSMALVHTQRCWTAPGLPIRTTCLVRRT